MSDDARVINVRPRLLEWVSIPLVVPAVLFATYILVSMIAGDPQFALALWIGAPLSIALMAYTIWRIGQHSYWRLDDTSLSWGRWSPQRVKIADIEALFVGMPDEMSGVGGAMARVPILGAAQSVALIRAWRQSALVLRLRDRRLLVIGLAAAHFRGGAALRAQLITRLAAVRVEATQYTGEERHVLAAHFVASRLVRLS